jgi:hypothetical protein
MNAVYSLRFPTPAYFGPDGPHLIWVKSDKLIACPGDISTGPEAHVSGGSADIYRGLLHKPGDEAPMIVAVKSFRHHVRSEKQADASQKACIVENLFESLADLWIDTPDYYTGTCTVEQTRAPQYPAALWDDIRPHAKSAAGISCRFALDGKWFVCFFADLTGCLDFPETSRNTPAILEE